MFLPRSRVHYWAMKIYMAFYRIMKFSGAICEIRNGVMKLFWLTLLATQLFWGSKSISQQEGEINYSGYKVDRLYIEWNYFVGLLRCFNGPLNFFLSGENVFSNRLKNQCFRTFEEAAPVDPLGRLLPVQYPWNTTSFPG